MNSSPKIGEDHGGRSLKESIQIVNTINPNSQGNTITFSIFKEKDY